MKKIEAIKYLTGKGFTKRVANKIFAKAVEGVDVPADNINAAIAEYMNSTNNDTENKED